jgi:hypothetical protein
VVSRVSDDLAGPVLYLSVERGAAKSTGRRIFLSATISTQKRVGDFLDDIGIISEPRCSDCRDDAMNPDRIVLLD